MFGRIALAVSLALSAVAGGAGCYDVPTPDCGFRCGAEDACPAGYACSALDGRCHRDGAPADLVCPGEPEEPDLSPSVVFTDPPPNAGDIPTTATIQARFSESVTGVTAETFYLSVLNGPAVPADVTYDPASRVALLVPAQPLASQTTYRATVTGGIVDGAGQGIDSGSGYSWDFATRDATPPMLTSRTPAVDATGVPVDVVLAIGFDEPVTGLASSWRLFAPGASFVAGVIDIDPNQRAATYTPGLQLAAMTRYEVELDQSPFQTVFDLSGNPLAGAPILWGFTTGADTAPPRLRLQQPIGIDVPRDTAITIAFDEPVTGVDRSSFVVDDGGAPPVQGTVTTSDGGVTWTFVPDAPLPASTSIAIRVSTAVTDLAGNALAAPLVLTFVTAA